MFTTKRYRREHPVAALGVKDFSQGMLVDLPGGKVKLLTAQVTVSSGRMRVENRDSTQRGTVTGYMEPGNSMNLFMATDVAVTKVDSVVEQARGLVENQDAFAAKHKIKRVIVTVCRTRTCAESKESVDEMFFFEKEGGKWVYKPDFFKDPW